MKRIFLIAAAPAAVVLVVLRCLAVQTSAPNLLPLKGIDSVVVLVGEIPSGAAEMGLTAEMIKNEVASRLKEVGLSVPGFSDEDPYLYIEVIVAGEAFSINISFRDYVVLKRDRKIACAAATWMQIVTGEHRKNGRLFLEGLGDLLDSFISDFHKANPKRRPK